jgi:hypothetical protein
MSTPESTTETVAETPTAATNGDGRDAPVATDTPASTTSWWKRLLGRS